MQVFKFGGASIKDGEAVKNVGNIVKAYGAEPLVVVVSAMGKTTRALEQLLESYTTGSFEQKFKNLQEYHIDILNNIFPADHEVFNEVEKQFSSLLNIDYQLADKILLHAKVVSFGEIISSIIIFHYLKLLGLKTHWLYAPEVVKTERQYSEGEVLWEETERRINKAIDTSIDANLVITQGYISDCTDGLITLGKEGSDFTAAIFATCLKAKNVIIWKDVPGILNADPKKVSECVQLYKLNYKEASEMTYYGASVIHPKTIKPLALNSIPLEVRSFDHPGQTGTIISHYNNVELIPGIIYKHNQCLVSFKVVDYTFVDEENLATVFKVLHDLNLPINMMQNSAISLSVCFDYDERKVDRLRSLLEDRFSIIYNTGLELVTIKNYTKAALKEYTPDKENIILEQKTRNNYRALVKKS